MPVLDHRPGAQQGHLTQWWGVGSVAQAVGQGAQDRDELGRVQDLEVEALDGDVKGELVE